MKKYYRRSLTTVIYWLLLCLLGLSFNRPALAGSTPAEGGETSPGVISPGETAPDEPAPADEKEPPPMDYQPPVDADHLEQFLPPETTLMRLDPQQRESAAVPIDPGQNTAVSFNDDQVAVIIEKGAFDQPVHLTFQLLASTMVTDTAQIAPADTVTPTPESTDGEGTPPADTATPTPEAIGDPGTEPPPAGDSAFPQSLVPQTLLQFQLEIYDAASGKPIETFGKQVRIVVDLRRLGFPLQADYHRFYLAYQDEALARESLWVDAPHWVHQSDGLLSAEVSHFSNWTAGWRPEVWTPSWTPPSVSAFSGAATYQYSIETPPGRGGLQPAVSLSYNSRVLDGAIRGVPEGSVASGWSLADIYIAREGIETFIDGEHLKLRHPDRFRLVLNGAGHELFPQPGVNTATEATVRYYAKDAPGLYVKRVYAATGVPNTEGIYWIVKTDDGVTYRLGYHGNAEEW